jgi:23S rRNA (uracil1939-C5)-methyltransferase
MSVHKRGTNIEIEIESLAFGGNGVGRTEDGLVVFVEDGLPGQLVKARLGKVKKNYAFATLDEVVRQSPHSCEPRCIHFGTCGGCRLQHLDYEMQVSAKGEQVRDTLQRIGGFEYPPVESAIPSPSIYGYRNKMEYSFGDVRWLDEEEMEHLESTAGRYFALGLHPRRRWNRIINLQQCHLPSPLSFEIVKLVQESASKSAYRPYTTKTHSGFWRFLIVREGVRTGQWMVDIITSDEPRAEGEVDALARRIKAVHPEVTTVTHTINRSKAAVASGDEERVVIGPGYIEESLPDLSTGLLPDQYRGSRTSLSGSRKTG